MTGSGTAAEPYIVDDWGEFLTLIGEGVYIKWADSGTKELNFDDIEPYGYDTPIVLKGNIDFNSWTLKNFHSIAQNAFELYNDVSLYNLTMENFTHHYTGSSRPHFIYYSGATSKANAVMSRCTFNGDIRYASGSTSAVAMRFCGIISPYKGRFRSCGFNISGESNIAAPLFTKASSNSSDQMLLEYCTIRCDITQHTRISSTVTSGSAINADLVGCHVIGAFTENNTELSEFPICTSGSALNVFEVTANKTLVYGGSGVSLYVDQRHTGDVVREGQIVRCSPEQAVGSQADVLAAGFPLRKKGT